MHAELDAAGISFAVVIGDRVTGDAEAQRPWVAVRPAHRWEVAGSEVQWTPVLRALRRADLVIVQQELRRLLNLALLAGQRLGGPPVAFFGHGRTPAVRWGGGRSYRSDVAPGIADRLKDAVSRQPHWWFAYNDLSARIVAELGFPADRITSVRNSIDTADLRRALERQPDPSVTRRRLGLPEGPVALYCGRLYAEKRLDFLVEALDRARELLPELQFLVVGDGPARPLVDAAAATRPWMHVVGARYGDDKVACFTVSDVLVMPGNVGLGVLDALVLATPLVTSRSSDHNPELDYLRDGGNGLIVDDEGASRAYGEAVADLLSAPGRLAELRATCEADGLRYSAETMADRFTSGILAALAAPRRPAVRPG